MTASRIVRRPIFITNIQKEITKANKKENEGNRNILYKKGKKKRKNRKRNHRTAEKAKKSKNKKKKKKFRNQENRAFVSHICTETRSIYTRVIELLLCERMRRRMLRGLMNGQICYKGAVDLSLICADFPRILSEPSPLFLRPSQKDYSRVTRCRVKVQIGSRFVSVRRV